MNSLSFQNRVSLSRKSEDITRTVEELSSCYAKREEFAVSNPHAFAMRTSEICVPLPVFVCGFYAFVGAVMAVVAGVVAAVGAAVLLWPAIDSLAMADFTTYKNIA